MDQTAASAIAAFHAGLSALPHSRQQVPWRGVMSPQNGHMRWDAKSPTRGSMPSDLLNHAARKARRLRALPRSACRGEIMAEIPCSGAAQRSSAAIGRERLHQQPRPIHQAKLDTSRLPILSKIALFSRTRPPHGSGLRLFHFRPERGSEQFRPAIFCFRTHDDAGVEFYLSLFQVF